MVNVWVLSRLSHTRDDSFKRSAPRLTSRGNKGHAVSIIVAGSGFRQQTSVLTGAVQNNSSPSTPTSPLQAGCGGSASTTNTYIVTINWQHPCMRHGTSFVVWFASEHNFQATTDFLTPTSVGTWFIALRIQLNRL